MSKVVLPNDLTIVPVNPHAGAGILVRRGEGDEVHVVNGARRLDVHLDLHGIAEVEVLGSGERLRVHRVDGQVTVLNSRD